MRRTSWLTGCGSETFCDIAAGRWPSQCEASYLWFMAPQWSCIFQSLCRVSKAGLLIGRRGGRVMMQMRIHARYNKFQPEEEEDKAGKVAKSGVSHLREVHPFFFLWPKRHQWWFHECFERQNHESFENESNSVMTHEPLRELTYWLQESAAYPFILFQNSSLSRKRKTCRLLGEQAAAWTMYLWVSKIHRWTDMKMDQKVWEIDLNAFAKRFRDISR